MASFSTQARPSDAIAELKLARGLRVTLRLNGVKARVAADIAVRVGTPSVAAAEVSSSPIDGPTGIWAVVVRALAAGDTTLAASFKQDTVATLKLTVFEPETLQLPDATTEAGLLARLLIAEAQSPAYRSYAADDTETSMAWMIAVINNRAKHPNPKLFGIIVTPGQPVTRAAVITARGQFRGFEHYPSVGAGEQKTIDDILAIANDYTHGGHDRYARHVKAAFAIAAKPDAVIDPAPRGLYGWRTANSSAPGGMLVKYKDLAAQTFYTLAP